MYDIESETNPIEEPAAQEPEELVLIEHNTSHETTNFAQAQYKPRCILPMFTNFYFTIIYRVMIVH